MWAALEGTLQDVRYAWRGLMRNPVFAVTAVVSLGLAIGANTAIYSILDAALLRPLPVPQPDRLFTLSTTDDGQPGMPAPAATTRSAIRCMSNFARRRAIRRGWPCWVHRIAWRRRHAEEDAPYEDVIQQLVSPDTFEVLGVSPALGRLCPPLKTIILAARRCGAEL